MACRWLSVRSSHSERARRVVSPVPVALRDCPPYGQADAIKDHREVGRQRGRIGVLAGLAPVAADLRFVGGKRQRRHGHRLRFRQGGHDRGGPRLVPGYDIRESQATVHPASG